MARNRSESCGSAASSTHHRDTGHRQIAAGGEADDPRCEEKSGIPGRGYERLRGRSGVERPKGHEEEERAGTALDDAGRDRSA